MNIELPESFPDFSTRNYWDSRYLAEPNTTYDWLLNYSQLKSVILPRISDQEAEIFVIGCGNSGFSEEIYKEGYHYISNIDFSPVVIEQMQSRNHQLSDVEYAVMDATNLQYPSSSFDVIFDKCTFDCILCGENSFQKATSMIQGVYRTLKPGGVFIMVSYGMPDTRIGYLKNKFLGWTIEQARIPKIQLDQFTNVELSQYHYIFICTKHI